MQRDRKDNRGYRANVLHVQTVYAWFRCFCIVPPIVFPALRCTFQLLDLPQMGRVNTSVIRAFVTRVLLVDRHCRVTSIRLTKTTRRLLRSELFFGPPPVRKQK